VSPRRNHHLLPSVHVLAPVIAGFAVLAAACQSSAPEPTAVVDQSKPASAAHATATAASTGATSQDATPVERPKPPKRKVAARPTASVKPSEDDPLKGKWTLDDAEKGLPAGKQLVATIDTDLGALECKLEGDKAPLTVANFIGLARGTRPWKTPDGKWEKKAAYDGTTFHRIVKGFMIQGGDAKKNGQGEPGYVIPDEIWEDANHDRPGLLCMANRGPNTNGAQFFITDDAAPHLDNGYTIFGECGPVDMVHKLASVEVVGERPKTPPVIKKITITRK
jgi:peptidyl-prolyl cis-trans isomerase A (cyclophilin A)